MQPPIKCISEVANAHSSKIIVFGPRDSTSEWTDAGGRLEFIEWLDKHCLPWTPVTWPRSDTFEPRYRGHIFVDVTYNPQLPQFKAICSFVEGPSEEETRWSDGCFCVYPRGWPSKWAGQ